MDWRHFLFLVVLQECFLATLGQNQPPTWVTSSYSGLTKGISEDTPVGAFLTQLSCTDPEGDPVRYNLVAGNAVQVLPNGTTLLAAKLDFEQKDTLGYDLEFGCRDVSSAGFYLHDPVSARVQFSVNDANDNYPIFQSANADGYAFFVHENVPVGTTVESAIQTVDADRTANAALKTMYLVCNSPNATERENLPETSREMCNYFNLTYTQQAEGVYNATITVIKGLDFETRPVFSSKIYAIDGPGLAVSLTSTVNIQIQLIDDQDMPPFFLNPGDTATVSEAAPLNSITGLNVSARDGDTGDKRPISLTILRDPLSAFNLTKAVQSNADGIYVSQLTVFRNLDRETVPSPYELIIEAIEIDKNTSQLVISDKTTATATYSIYLADVNDNLPQFYQSVYAINVTEVDSSINSTSPSQITGLHIICADLDEPSNARFTVNIVQQLVGVNTSPANISGAYSISPKVSNFTGNASIFLTVDNTFYLDYDNPQFRTQKVVLVANEFNPRMRYTGPESQRASTTTTVLISLIDINDNAPEFDASNYSVSVLENATFPRDLLSISAHDKDSGINGQIRYRLEGESLGKFSLDNVTGLLKLIGALDYETASSYVLLAYATDMADDPKSSQVQITVNVQNVNDVAPRFRQNLYQTSVGESSLKFLNPVSVTAVDDEEGSTNITYRIMSGNSAANAFVLNAITGELNLTSYLDYTDTPKNANGSPSGVYTLLVEASDNGSPPLFAYAVVNVTVLDENNHAPELFPVFYFAVLNESVPAGTRVVRINGTDQDAGDNGKISYRLGAGSTDNFAVNETDGWFFVGPAPFDYDVQRFFNVSIVVTDGGAPQKSAMGYVIINITDVNNKDPVFDDVLFFFTIDDRNPPGTVVSNVTAFDRDSDHLLQYSIVASSIQATDPNGRPITSTATYDYMSAFRVDPSNGSIYIKSKLNHNLMAEITFSLKVNDTKTQVGVGTATTQITISIRGAVDQSITFDLVGGTVFMNEDAIVGYSPITVTARDPNKQPVRNYNKVQELSSANFAVSGTDGRVTLSTKIDYENDPVPDHMHRIVINATGPNQQSASVTVTVSVVDVNDNVPQMNPTNYTVSVLETAVYPTSVVNIYATDADSSTYGPLTFSLSGLDADNFQIFLQPVPSGSLVSRSGQVIVGKNKALDFNRRDRYDLTIIVTDNANRLNSNTQNSNFAPLTIYVIDVNNHAPVFKESNRSLAVAETAEISRSIAIVIATDEDRDRNGEIVYSLQAINDPGNPNNAYGPFLFSINPQSGMVQVAQSLIGRGNQQFIMRVVATDRGDNPNSGYMTLYITVLSTETNDGNPKWFYPPVGYIAYAPEEQAPVNVTDFYNATLMLNAVPQTGSGIVYYLSNFSDSPNSFSVDPNSGFITVQKPLDREKKASYILLINAADTNDTMKYYSGRQITVMLLDKNDNNATFTNPQNYESCLRTDRPLELSVEENVGANFTISVLKACDPDQPPNNMIVYKLYMGNPYCAENNNKSSIDVTSDGMLITKSNIDYEQNREFIMCVQATAPETPLAGRRKRAIDLVQAYPLMDNVAYIHIAVIDLNDNGPHFSNPSQVGVVQVNPTSSPITTLSANDPDGPGNNGILYRIESSQYYPQGDDAPYPVSGAFTVRPDSGVLYPGYSSYQIYAGGRFVINVVAYDTSNSSQSDSQTVTIYVYKEGEAAKVVLNLMPADGSSYGQPIVMDLNGVDTSRYQFQFLRASEHQSLDSIDYTKTDVCFIVLDTTQNTILNVQQVVEVLDRSGYKNVLSQTKYKVVDDGKCFPKGSSTSRVKWGDLWWVLVAIAIFIFVCCLILIILISILYYKYKRFQETQQTSLVPRS